MTRRRIGIVGAIFQDALQAVLQPSLTVREPGRPDYRPNAQKVKTALEPSARLYIERNPGISMSV